MQATRAIIYTVQGNLEKKCNKTFEERHENKCCDLLISSIFCSKARHECPAIYT